MLYSVVVVVVVLGICACMGFCIVSLLIDLTRNPSFLCTLIFGTGILINRPKDLKADLNLDEALALKIVQAAKDATLFEKRKNNVQKTWKAVQDSLQADATKLFYQRLFETYPSVKSMFSEADMEAQAEKLYKTVGLAVDYLDDVESLLPVLEDMGAKVSTVYIQYST